MRKWQRQFSKFLQTPFTVSAAIRVFGMMKTLHFCWRPSLGHWVSRLERRLEMISKDRQLGPFVMLLRSGSSVLTAPLARLSMLLLPLCHGSCHGCQNGNMIMFYCSIVADCL